MFCTRALRSGKGIWTNLKSLVTLDQHMQYSINLTCRKKQKRIWTFGTQPPWIILVDKVHEIWKTGNNKNNSMKMRTWFSSMNLGNFPSSIYSWFFKPLSVLHSRFPNKKLWVVAYFFNFFQLFQKQKKIIIKAILCNFSMRLLKCF